MVSPLRRSVRLVVETELMPLSGIERRSLDCPYHSRVDLRIFRTHSRTFLQSPWYSNSQARICNQNFYLRCTVVVNSAIVKYFDY